MKMRRVCAASALVALLSGCHVRKVEQLTPAQVPQPEQVSIVGITTLKAEAVSFDKPGAVINNGQVSGQVHKTPYSIPLDQVQRLWVEHRTLSKGRTIGLTAALAVGTFVTIAAIEVATKQSCPFVYSWNGTEFQFDAEPYGGAITHGLEKDDYSALERLRPENGHYRLLLTNEVDEEQFTNLMELWVVDHAPGVRVAADPNGNLHTLGDLRAPMAAVDGDGRDLMPWLRADDTLIWEPLAVPDSNGNLRRDVVLTFDKPEGVRTAKLVANAATALWGSYMIKRIVELRGRETGAWLQLLDTHPEEVKALFDWDLHEELYALKIYVEEPTGWKVRGILPGTGPFISKQRVIPLDLSQVRGNQVRIRLRPPAGFWALNSFALDYSPDTAVHLTTLLPSRAQDVRKRNLLPELIAGDKLYYAMPTNDDKAEIDFNVPPEVPGRGRTIFLHSRGYYRLHLKAVGEPDLARLEKIQNVPDAAAHFGAEMFARWRAERGATTGF